MSISLRLLAVLFTCLLATTATAGTVVINFAYVSYSFTEEGSPLVICPAVDPACHGTREVFRFDVAEGQDGFFYASSNFASGSGANTVLNTGGVTLKSSIYPVLSNPSHNYNFHEFSVQAANGVATVAGQIWRGDNAYYFGDGTLLYDANVGTVLLTYMGKWQLTYSSDLTSMPLPAGGWLLFAGLAGLTMVRRQIRRAA